MSYIEGDHREQITLFPEMIDDYIDKNNVVRFIDAFVNSLGMEKLGFKYSRPKQGSGRYSYNPSDMLKLYLYGYINNVRSSRKLEVEAHRNIEVMWLIGKLKPDHKTISNFRSDNKACFRGVFREFTLFCIELKLFEDKLIAIDGSRFKANNATNKCFTKKRLTKKLQEIDQTINKYLEMLESNDNADDKSEVIDEHLQEKIKKMLERKKNYKKIYQDLEKSGDTQISLTDPDSRIMKTQKGLDVSYNIQVATSETHKLIIDFETTNSAADQILLSKMAIKAKEALGLEEMDVLADTGYYNCLEVKKCVDNDIIPYVPKPKIFTSTAKQEFYKDNFIYDKEKDVYICPNNQELRFKTNYTDDKGLKMRKYLGENCNNCPDKSKCTTNKRGRTVTRWQNEKLMEEMQQRIKSNPGIMKKRSSLVEHPFGTVKRSFGFDYQLLRTLEKVDAEFSLTFLVYNIKRLMNILGKDNLIEAIGS